MGRAFNDNGQWEAGPRPVGGGATASGRRGRGQRMLYRASPVGALSDVLLMMDPLCIFLSSILYLNYPPFLIICPQ